MQKRIEHIQKINDAWMQSELCAPASESEIAEFEKKMQIVIPESYKAFLRISNGATLFGGDCILFSVSPEETRRINYDFSRGNVPEALLIVGAYNSAHICYDARYDSFFFYEYEGYAHIKEECAEFSDFYEVLDYMIEIAEN